MAQSTSSNFLDSMTFLDHDLLRCDCDECDNSVPPSIRDAVRQRKRQRLEMGPMKRTQDRTLVCRYSVINSDRINTAISVWKWTMPMNAEPLIEFGSSHRLVWIKRLPTTKDNDDRDRAIDGTLRSIGKGIIGSRDEEKSRIELEDWREGCVLLVPSNGGKAVGWIHTTTTTTASDDKTKSRNTEVGQGPAVLYVAKIPLDSPNTHVDRDIKREDKNGTKTNNYDYNWVKQLLRHCEDGLNKLHLVNLEEDGKIKPLSPSSSSQPYYIFPKDASEILKSAFREAMRSTQGGTQAAASSPGLKNRPEIPIHVEAANNTEHD